MDATVYSFTHSDLEENADFIKTVIVKSLIEDGLLPEKEAEEWCKNHTLVIKTKSIFRTISELWNESEEATDGYFYYIVVGKHPDKTKPITNKRSTTKKTSTKKTTSTTTKKKTTASKPKKKLKENENNRGSNKK